MVLVGRRYKNATILQPQSFTQVRLFCWFTTGWLSYAEWNIRLFFYLLFRKMDAICAVDLDTILPCYLISVIKRCRRVYDAHELFTEMKEIISRPMVKKCWLAIEKFAVPRFKYGYTVSDSIALEFKKRYVTHFETIRNLPLKGNSALTGQPTKRIILYQGAVNHARGLEELVPAMKLIDAELQIYGKGNFEQEVKSLIIRHHLGHKVKLYPPVEPSKLQEITAQACIGINLVENIGLNQYYSLANKFFDYIQAGIPQVTMKYPEYEKINRQYQVAVLIEGTEEKAIAAACNRLLEDESLYKRLKANCTQAAKVYNWQEEEKKLIAFYQKLFCK